MVCTMCVYGSFFYSLDKIKFTGRIKRAPPNFQGSFFNYVNTWISLRLPKGYDLVNAGESLLPFRYRHWYDIRKKDDIEGTFHIEQSYNGDFKESRPIPEAFQIEFNPNKSGFALWESFCDYFAFTVSDIKKFDIAYDLPNADLRNVHLETKADVMKYGKTSCQTLYIAPKAETGRVKVYQKDEEREAKGRALGKTLRIECTIRPRMLFRTSSLTTPKDLEPFETAATHLNSVKIRTVEKGSADDWKLFALARLSPDDLEKALAMMSNDARAKYRKLLNASGETLSLSLDPFTLYAHCQKILAPWIERMKI